jgi:two-component system alkaline phosphatase synthesis response regulator PhoP
MSKIMLIDDDETMISLLQTLLEMDGFEVVSTSNWRNIPDDLVASDPDLLLMDCNLPEIDGLEILAEVRREKILPNLHIIMTSGMDMEYRAMASGADAFLLKPYTPDTLYELIQKIMGS